jgi:hypothetical protein
MDHRATDLCAALPAADPYRFGVFRCGNVSRRLLIEFERLQSPELALYTTTDIGPWSDWTTEAAQVTSQEYYIRYPSFERKLLANAAPLPDPGSKDSSYQYTLDHGGFS